MMLLKFEDASKKLTSLFKLNVFWFWILSTFLVNLENIIENLSTNFLILIEIVLFSEN